MVSSMAGFTLIYIIASNFVGSMANILEFSLLKLEYHRARALGDYVKPMQL